jgi:chromosome partitioning protein
MTKQVVLWIGANAGGVSKTTLTVHIGYEMAARHGMKVLALDLDTNVSMAQFCGLPKDRPWEQTTALIFNEEFDGNYPVVTPRWGSFSKGQFDVCLGGTVMIQVSLDLATRSRREYTIADVLGDYPLPYDLILLDCPASLGTLSDVALAASTHLLLPIEVSSKSLSGTDALLTWYRVNCRKLRLKPVPSVLGVVPVQYDKEEAQQRSLMETLPEALKQQSIDCYPPVRYTPEFKNSAMQGVPLQVHRPKHRALEDLQPICNDLEALIHG